MKFLMTKGMFAHPMAEAGTEGGGTTQGGEPQTQGQGDTRTGGGNPAPTDGGGQGAGGDGHGDGQPEKKDGDGEIVDKPFLGNQPTKKEGQQADNNKSEGDGQGKKKGGEGEDKPQPPEEKAYLDGVKADENVFGKDNGFAFDEKLVKSVIPVCQKHGISVEVANEMANAFAKAQMDGAKAAMKERSDRFQKMNAEARAKFTDKDFETINKGIDKVFKPGGAMNFTVRNSELGSDLEFLALMLEVGSAEADDHGEGAAAGGGDGGGDPNGSQGMSKIW